MIFSVRVRYQWYYSHKRGESVLPIGFWVIGLIGSLMIIPYAVIRGKWAYLIGQFTGVVVYSRNIMISLSERRVAREVEE